MSKWPSNTRLKLVEATVMFILHFPVFFNIAFENIKTTLMKSGLCAFMPATRTYCSYVEYFISSPSVPQTLTTFVRWMQTCTGAQEPDPFQSCSSVSGMCCYQCFKAGMMLMGPQLCPVITAQPKRGLKPP